jgi:TRAP-type mannitol/chloroaromatic compound transport system substrate-binding protein
VLSDFVANNNRALEALVNEHGVELRPFSENILSSLGEISGEVMNDLASADPTSREVMDSLLRFRQQAAAWSDLSEQSYLAARALDYPYAQPSGG